MNMHCKNYKGSALIIAMLVASVVFNVGTVIVSISEKDILRQIAIQESTKALNILDTAWECSLYHDFQLRFFRAQNPERTINCGGGLSAFKKNGREYSETEQFRQCNTTVDRIKQREEIVCEFLLRDENPETFRQKPCAIVSLKKSCSLSVNDPDRCGSEFNTTLDIIGYTSCYTDSGRVIHRRVHSEY